MALAVQFLVRVAYASVPVTLLAHLHKLHRQGIMTKESGIGDNALIAGHAIYTDKELYQICVSQLNWIRPYS